MEKCMNNKRKNKTTESLATVERERERERERAYFLIDKNKIKNMINHKKIGIICLYENTG